MKVELCRDINVRFNIAQNITKQFRFAEVLLISYAAAAKGEVSSNIHNNVFKTQII